MNNEFSRKIKDRIKSLFPSKKVQFNETLSIKVEQIFTDQSLNGLITSHDSVIARPFNVLIEDGRNVGRVNYLFYKEKNSKKSYIIGALCYTSYSKEKSRLIFFPGFLNRKILKHSKLGNSSENIRLDHITIEPDFKTWHYTAFKEGEAQKTVYPNNNIVEVEPGLFAWFSVSLNSTKFLEELFQQYNFEFTIPSEGIDSIKEKLFTAKENSKPFISELPDEDIDESKEFLHFDFFIDKRKNRDTASFLKQSSAPLSAPVLVSDVQNHDYKFKMMQYEIPVQDFDGIITMIVSKHHGKLTEDIFITSR